MISKLAPFGALAAIIIAVLTALSVSGAVDNEGADDALLRGDGGEGAEVAALCAEGVEDCDDTIENADTDTQDGDDLDEAPPPDKSAGSCLEGATDCVDDLDEPVSICAPDAPDCDDIVDEPEEPDSGSGSEGPSNGDADEELAIDAAFQALAAMNGVTEGAEVSGIRAVEWPDACLGVYEEGIACAEVITPGFTVILSGPGGDYEFHTDLNGNAVFVSAELVIDRNQ